MARARALDKSREAQRDAALDVDVKTIKTGEALRAVLLSLSAEANLSVEEMPEGTKVETSLPVKGNTNLSDGRGPRRPSSSGFP
jgi:hypothetical protein